MATPWAPIAGIVYEIIDKIIPDPNKKQELKAKIHQMELNGELREIELQLSAIIMEAQSSDPWTSRARPSFLYVVYIYILAAIPFGILYAFTPVVAVEVTNGIKAWLNAIPEPMWWLFGAGYLGYTGARSLDKHTIASTKPSNKPMGAITNLFNH